MNPSCPEAAVVVGVLIVVAAIGRALYDLCDLHRHSTIVCVLLALAGAIVIAVSQ